MFLYNWISHAGCISPYRNAECFLAWIQWIMSWVYVIWQSIRSKQNAPYKLIEPDDRLLSSANSSFWFSQKNSSSCIMTVVWFCSFNILRVTEQDYGDATPAVTGVCPLLVIVQRSEDMNITQRDYIYKKTLTVRRPRALPLRYISDSQLATSERSLKWLK